MSSHAEATATAIETTDFYPYGTARVDTKVGTYVGEKNKYAGTQNDSVSNLNYMMARYQDPARGQFLSEDPVFLGDPKQEVLADPQSLNSYSYANDNPIIKSDPDGRFAIGGNYSVNYEGGFGGFSVVNTGGGSNVVFDPATMRFSVVNTASGAVSSGYLKNYQSAPDNGRPPFVIGLWGGKGFSISISPNATKPSDFNDVQDSINFNFGPFTFGVQGADTNNPTYTLGAGAKDIASFSRYPIATRVVSTQTIGQAANSAYTRYQSAVASIQAQIKDIQGKINQLVSSKQSDKKQ